MLYRLSVQTNHKKEKEKARGYLVFRRSLLRRKENRRLMISTGEGGREGIKRNPYLSGAGERGKEGGGEKWLLLCGQGEEEKEK